MVPLKTQKELELVRKSGEILARIIQELKARINIDVTTLELDQFAAELMRKNNCLSAFKDYKGFPANICVSVNEEVVHGIPSTRKLNEGDIVSIDAGINFAGYFSDAAITVGVGEIDNLSKKLIEITRSALKKGIEQAKVNNRISDISYAIQNYVESNGFSVVRQFVGHGIGKALHEEPEIPNFGLPHKGDVIKTGMVLAIEPMVNMGGWECEILDNGWTAVTKDRNPSAHFEHTVAITDKGAEILTKLHG